MEQEARESPSDRLAATEALIARAADLGCSVRVVQMLDRLETKIAHLHKRLVEIESRA